MKKLLTLFASLLLLASLGWAYITNAATNSAIVSNTTVIKSSDVQHNPLTKVDYPGFTVYMDCQNRIESMFEFTVGKDKLNIPRTNDFHIDQDFNKDCQQLTVKSYGSQYDRGHGVNYNIDLGEKTAYATNSATNFTPQRKDVNRGVWLLTEEITECYRDINQLNVIGGTILLKNRKNSNDAFLQGWGIPTPDYFYKVIIDEKGKRNIAWLIPNSTKNVKRNFKDLDRYIVSIDTINLLTGNQIKPRNSKTSSVEPSSWPLTPRCDLS